MNLQSRSKRWLAVVEVAQVMTSGLVDGFEQYASIGREVDEQTQKTVIDGLYQLPLTAEADPVVEGEPLYEILGEVVAAMNGLECGPDFVAGLRRLDSALKAAGESLRVRTVDDDANLDEIISSLERAFLLSLIITLTSHHFLVDWEDKWQDHHQEYLAGLKASDRPHYVQINGLLPASSPGRGRVHVQHLHSALRAGTVLFVMGAPQQAVPHYPEFQSIIYSQWFAYMHAIWDEQFRARIAAHFSTPDAPLEKDDVLNDFFGDIRLIRNDYVHNKGIATNAVKCKLSLWCFKRGEPLDITAVQMLSLIELFPREALTIKPTARPTSTRTQVPGSVDLALKEAFVERTKKLKISMNAAADEAITMWLASKADD